MIEKFAGIGSSSVREFLDLNHTSFVDFLERDRFRWNRIRDPSEA
jgi:hypothetical protein